MPVAIFEIKDKYYFSKPNRPGQSELAASKYYHCEQRESPTTSNIITVPNSHKDHFGFNKKTNFFRGQLWRSRLRVYLLPVAVLGVVSSSVVGRGSPADYGAR